MRATSKVHQAWSARHGLTWNGSRLIAEASNCSFTWRPFATLDASVAMHYESDELYDRFEGVSATTSHCVLPSPPSSAQWFASTPHRYH